MKGKVTERDHLLERRRGLKRSYGRLYAEVATILFEHDPVGINFETNADEYEPEVDAILPRLTTARGAQDVRRIVFEEFVRLFSPDEVGDESRFTALAEAIWTAYQAFGRNM